MFFKNPDYSYIIFVFISALILVSSVGIPNLLLNDSLITVEQLSQLSSGDQIRFSEGKYGHQEDGTEYGYFSARKGILLYSLILPIISLPALFLINLFGIYFNILIIVTWAFLLLLWVLLLGIIIRNDEYLFFRFQKFLPFMLLFIFSLFFLNLFLYFPNISSSSQPYYEIPAVILTNHILFALIAVFSFMIFRLLNYSRLLSLVYSMSIIFCSSYLFWSSDAKDHILVSLLIAIFSYFLILFILSNKSYCYYLSLITMGIITWTRPEVGLAVFFLLVLFSFFWMYSGKISNNTGVLKFITFSVVFCLVGLSPFFINNILVTDNPFTPAFIGEKFDTNLTENTPDNGIINSVYLDLTNSVGLNKIFAGIKQIPDMFLSSPITLLKIFINPDSGSMGVFAVNPLPMVCIILITLYLLNKFRFELNTNEKKISIIFSILSLFIIGIYLLIDYDGLNLSHGVAPDIRYISPAYLPLSVASLVMLRPILAQCIKKDIFTRIFLTWFVVIFVFMVFFLISPIRDISHDNDLLTVFSLIATVLFIIGLLLHQKNRLSESSIITLFSIIIIIPFFWQMDTLLYYSCRRPWGYDFWLPLSSYIYNSLLGHFCI